MYVIRVRAGAPIRADDAPIYLSIYLYIYSFIYLFILTEYELAHQFEQTMHLAPADFRDQVCVHVCMCACVRVCVYVCVCVCVCVPCTWPRLLSGMEELSSDKIASCERIFF
jgi:hypothetical protein